MRKCLFGSLALGSALIATSAWAHPAPAPLSSQSIVQDVGHRGWGGPRWGYGYGPGFGYGYGYRGCGRARHICADRWGWGGPGFRRCMWRHGC